MFQTLVDANGMSVGLRVAAIWIVFLFNERPLVPGPFGSAYGLSSRRPYCLR